MSIVNIWVGQRVATVAVDTRGESVERGFVFDGMGKLVPLPHIQSVLAFRGCNAFGVAAAATILGSAFDDLDVAVENMPDVAAVAQWVLLKNFPAASAAGSRSDRAQELYLAGWSPREQACAAWMWSWDEAIDRYAPRRITHGSYAPAVAGLPGMPDPRSDANLVAFAREQIARYPADVGEQPPGGRLSIARISRTLITLSSEPL